jgi:hypothetical protein
VPAGEDVYQDSMKPRITIGMQVTHVINDQKQGLVTGILRPDSPGIRVRWDNMDVLWHTKDELVPRPPKTTKVGFIP